MTDLKSLDLGANPNITDAGAKNLQKLVKLQQLNIYGTNVADDGLQYLAGMTDLRNLELHNSCVSERGLEHLKKLVNLQRLELPKLAPDPVQELQRALPGCSIAVSEQPATFRLPPANTPALKGEAWSAEWQLLTNTREPDDAKIDPHLYRHGWFEGELGPDYGNRPADEGAGKHPGLLILHPLWIDHPAKARFRGTITRENPVMRVIAGGSIHGDCVLRCVVDGNALKEYVLDGTKWSNCEFDLSPFAGKSVELELWNVPGGKQEWQFETCYIDRIEFGH